MQILNDSVEMVKLSSLKTHPENPRRGNLEELKSSINTNGFWGAVVVQKSTNHILAGNHRVMAARDLGAKKMPVVFVDVDDQTAKRILIADNRITDLGENDPEQLTKILEELSNTELSLEGTGYQADDLDLLLQEFAKPETFEPDDQGNRDDQIPEIREAKTKPGDVIQIGDHVLHCGDCLAIMKNMPDNSIDSICTDPPYGIGFMGKGWDCAVPGEGFAREALRVLKPGGHLIAFAATRTVHRLAVALEDAGFEIRDQIAWLQWQGFPKSLDVSKALDQHHGAERAVLSERPAFGIGQNGAAFNGHKDGATHKITAPATDDAKKWEGWGTALKPSQEPAILARKPLEGTVAENVIQWGTGGINVDGCRYAYGDPAWPGPQERYKDGDGRETGPSNVGWGQSASMNVFVTQSHDLGRWPANIYHCPKPSRGEREQGCDDLDTVTGAEAVERKEGTAGLDNPRAGAGRTAAEIRNFHPTVKPVRLMRWLIKLITPPGGTALEPFAGSGTTLIAAQREGFKTIAIEQEPAYCDIIRARLGSALKENNEK